MEKDLEKLNYYFQLEFNNQVLFYGQSYNSNIDKIIELLIKSSNKMFQPAMLLLRLVIMKKYILFH